jgi:hypothetical protein
MINKLNTFTLWKSLNSTGQGKMMICKITGHEYHQLHESFSLAKNKISVIRVIRG